MFPWRTNFLKLYVFSKFLIFLSEGGVIKTDNTERLRKKEIESESEGRDKERDCVLLIQWEREIGYKAREWEKVE